MSLFESSDMNVEFECIVCGLTATASVDKEVVESAERPLQTLRDCSLCGMETIWLESST